VENCFFTAICNPQEFESEGGFRSWLLRILIDEALQILRQKKGASTTSPESVFSDSANPGVAPAFALVRYTQSVANKISSFFGYSRYNLGGNKESQKCPRPSTVRPTPKPQPQANLRMRHRPQHQGESCPKPRRLANPLLPKTPFRSVLQPRQHSRN
jgi:hypothetical protein